MPGRLVEIGFSEVDFIANFDNTDSYCEMMAGVIKPRGKIVGIVERARPTGLGRLKARSSHIYLGVHPVEISDARHGGLGAAADRDRSAARCRRAYGGNLCCQSPRGASARRIRRTHRKTRIERIELMTPLFGLCWNLHSSSPAACGRLRAAFLNPLREKPAPAHDHA